MDDIKPTIKAGAMVFSDEMGLVFVKLPPVRTGYAYKAVNYDEVIDAKLVENGRSTSIGRAFAGGLLFGGAGAIVASSTGKGKCDQLDIVITVRDTKQPALQACFIDRPLKRDNDQFRQIMNNVQESLSKIKLIIDENSRAEVEPTAVFSPADEILKYKNLLDMGAITQQEYDAKKKQLLDL
ncbi:MAG: SHOCT domain-containing protein [Atopobiaceae bacterium]|jgi:hypothetical protein|nr:SHOCT domain-containing protein [Atopobiaceae bacterium]MCI2206928.1 SHOCT domain-containing protein [Atopobiaceae bacterium]